MDWMQQIDAYCERTDFSFWSEPLNALTNLFYLAGGVGMYLRVRRDGLPLAVLMSVLLALIAVGSFLFHTVATVWASTADTTPIGLFILAYLYAVNRDMLSLPWWGAALGTAAFVPYAAIMVPLLDRLPFLHISNFYWTVPLLLLAISPLVARTSPQSARGLLIGAGLLCVSICIRSVDQTLCAVFPIGTHFLWHSLNAIMLPWMIETYRRHMLAHRALCGTV